MTSLHHGRATLPLLSLLVLCACRSDPAPAAVMPVVAPRPWAYATSDIPVDPRIHFGSLPNGMRWAWAENREPESRSYLRLHVDVGSLAEEDEERGLAHFLEHMAFNGSAQFPAGTLIEWFQGHGMSFGADTNAHTAFSETVYKLDLPESDPATLSDGLRVLRDFADGLTLATVEIDAEKGVIDGEERERDSPGMRLLERELDLAFDGTRVAERLPIGVRAVRAGFDEEAVRAFYERWYRPDAMTLVLVGDLRGLDPAPLFASAFGDLRAPPTPLPAEPPIGAASNYAPSYVITEVEIPTVTLSLQRLVPWVQEPTTQAEWLADLPLDYAYAMLNLRYGEFAKREGAAFLGANVARAEALEVFDGAALNVTCDPERWRAGLAFCEQELRRALQDGFAQAELDEVRANALRSLEESVVREPSAHSEALLGGILAAAEDPFVPTDAATRRAILRPALEALSIEVCHAALVEAWSAGEPSLTATGNLDLGPDGGAQLLAAYAESAAAPLAVAEVVESLPFAYASDPERAGAVTERREVDDLEFSALTFANGVRLNVKRTDFKQNQILVGVRVGEGRLSLLPEQYVLEWVGNQVMGGSGLAAHSTDDLRRLTAGKRVGVNFGIGIDSFALNGATTPEDLLFELELVAALITAPGWRADGLTPFRSQVPLFFQSLAHQHQGPVYREFLPALYDGDPRFGLPTEDAIAAVDMQVLRAWLEPEFADAPIEISLVGDLDVEQAVAAVARTLGALPQRRELRAHDAARNVPAPHSGMRQQHGVATEDDKSLVLVVYPLPDGLDSARARRFALLDAVLADRLRVNVREKLGAAYAPATYLQMNPVYPGVGSWTLEAMAEPTQAEALVEAFLSTAETLARDGVGAEELERLRAPILKQRRDSKRTNGYWMAVLERAQLDPAHLDKVRGSDAVYESTTAEELAPLAREFLTRERASIVVVDPLP